MVEPKNSKKIPAKAKVNKKDTTKVDDKKPKSSADDSSADQTSNKLPEKSIDAPKSASQRSISHFSSVSSKEYRSGWAEIFGQKKGIKSK